MKKKEYFILVVGIIIILIAPTILTQPAIKSIWNFSETGSIGDTIGGITTPFIGLLGALLVFLSFKQQIKANEKLEKQIKFGQWTTNYEILNNVFDEIRIETERLTYDPNIYEGNNEKIKTGLEAFKSFSESIESEINVQRPLNEFEENLGYIFSLHEIFLNQLNQIDLSKNFKIILFSKYNHYYEKHLSFYFSRILHMIKENKTDRFDNLKNNLLKIKIEREKLLK